MLFEADTDGFLSCTEGGFTESFPSLVRKTLKMRVRAKLPDIQEGEAEGKSDGPVIAPPTMRDPDYIDDLDSEPGLDEEEIRNTSEVEEPSLIQKRLVQRVHIKLGHPAERVFIRILRHGRVRNGILRLWCNCPSESRSRYCSFLPF